MSQNYQYWDIWKPMEHAPNTMSLVDQSGRRKYLTANELLRFIRAASRETPPRHLFAMMLLLTGCRISEALALRRDSFDLEAGYVIFRTLKQRQRPQQRPASTLRKMGQWILSHATNIPEKSPPPVYRYRTVPLPKSYMQALVTHFDLEANVETNADKLWPVNRRTGYRWIVEIMRAAHVTGRQARPHALRHSFGILCTEGCTPSPLLQRWMGHADIGATLIYQQFWGEEELNHIRRMWILLRVDKLDDSYL